MTLLSVQNLTLAAGPKSLVQDISFDIAKGEFLALAGASGSGKSLTALALLQLLPPGIRQTAGRISLAGADITAPKNLRAIRGRTASLIFQDTAALNPLARAGTQLAEAFAVHNRPVSRETLHAHFARYGLPERTARAYPHELSGGQRQRVAIAIALANDPSLLIADEPTTALDATTKLEILTLLKKSQQATGLSLLFITHDVPLIHRYADRILVIESGRIAAATPAAARPLPPPPPAPPGPPILTVENISLTYGRIPALADISLTLHAGETLGLAGASGAGKSSLANILLMLTKPDAGKILLHGANIFALPARQRRARRRQLQIVFQTPAFSPRLTAAHIVGEGLRIHEPTLTRDAHEARIAAAITEVGLPPDCLHRYPHEFSGGQRQRIAIARALILRPDILILDEPTSSLDAAIQTEILALLRDIQRTTNTAYIFISHDLAVLRTISHRIAILHAGRIIESGPAAEILANPSTATTKQLLAAAQPHDPTLDTAPVTGKNALQTGASP
jgi:microcin C transport system ATP-binding protein